MEKFRIVRKHENRYTIWGMVEKIKTDVDKLILVSIMK